MNGTSFLVLSLTSVALVVGCGSEASTITDPAPTEPVSSSDAGGDARASDGGATDVGDSAHSGFADECANEPKLHPAGGTKGLRCPNGPKGEVLECLHTSGICCVPTSPAPAPSFCGQEYEYGGNGCGWDGEGSSPVRGMAIGCEDPSYDCPTGSVCCGQFDATATLSSATCDSYRLQDDSTLGHTHCATSCEVYENFRICASDGQCAAGEKCHAMRVNGVIDLGFCR